MTSTPTSASATRAPAIDRTMSAGTWARLLLLGLIWGGSFFFARVAVAELHPLMLVLCRVALAAATLHLYLAVVGPSFRLALPHWRGLLLLGVLNNVIPFSLIFTGQTVLGAGLASVLNATTPFWTLLVASRLTGDEPLSWNRMAGVLLGIAGTAVMILPGLHEGLDGPLYAKLALVGASISYAFALILARRLRALPPPILATGQLTASTIVMTPVMLVIGAGGADGAGLTVWGAVIGLAVLSTAFAYLLYFGIVARAGATNASLVTLIVPVSAILLGTIFLGESMALVEFAGMAIIFAGLLAIDGRLGRRLRKR